MNSNLEKYLKYLLLKKESQGFTLIELLVVVIIIGVLSAVALPNLFGQVEKARTSEARQFLGTLNRSQQAYFFQTSGFASTFDDLGSNVTLSSKIYDYTITIPASVNEIHHEATPKSLYAKDLKALESAVYRIGNSFDTVVCIGNVVGDNPEITTPNNCNNGGFIN